MSSGGSSEQLELVNNNRSSVISSGGSTDDITDTYEPIQDYLVGTSVPEDNVRMSIISMTTGNAPNYPAPPPPEPEDDDDGYTEVSVIKGGGVASTFTHNPDWAELPLKTDHAHKGSHSPELTNRMSSSPRDSSPKMATTKHSRAKLSPEPTTPPPSPPLIETTPTNSVATPPQPRPPSPLTQRSAVVDSGGPKLPPKKRSLMSSPSDDIPMATNSAHEPGDNVYFDHLVTGPLEKTTPILENTTPIIIAAPVEDAVYFDHLVEPLLPATQTTNQNTASSNVTLNQNEDNVYFDHLVTGQPVVNDQRSLPEQPASDDAVYVLAGPPSEPPPRLPSELPPRLPSELPPRLPSKSDKPLPRTPSEEQQGMYT